MSRITKMILLFQIVLTFTLQGQDVKIPRIPNEWPLHVKSQLTRTRDTLISHLKAYDKKVNEFNARCGSVKEDNTALIASCQKESDLLDTESAALDKERDHFLFLFHDYEKIYAAYLQSKTSEKILEAVKKDSAAYSSQLQKLYRDIDHIKVPPPSTPHKIHEGVLLGLFNTDKINAITDTSRHLDSSWTGNSAWTGKKYKPGEFFATSDNLSVRELYRGLMDNNYLGEYTLNTPHGKGLVEKLYGTQFERLVAHSNGATVAEALIRKGVITVDELNIVGGDRSMINGLGYQELIASGKVKRIVVWYNPGDIIPMGSTAAIIVSPMVVAKEQYIDMAISYLTMLVTGRNQGGDTKVEYRSLKGTQYKGQELQGGKKVFDAHGLDVYQQNIHEYLRRSTK